MEQVLRYDTAVKVWNVKEPVWRWGDKHWGYMATLCNLMLTNKRLVFIEVSDKVDTGYFTGVPALDLLDTMEAMNREKARAAEIEATDLDKLKGDQVLLQNILEVKGYRHWNTLSGAYYLRVRYRSNGEERFKSVIFGEGFMAKKAWIEAITNAKNYLRSITTKPTHRTTPTSRGQVESM